MPSPEGAAPPDINSALPVSQGLSLSDLDIHISFEFLLHEFFLIVIVFYL
jgi:hypothetical protein